MSVWVGSGHAAFPLHAGPASPSAPPRFTLLQRLGLCLAAVRCHLWLAVIVFCATVLAGAGLFISRPPVWTGRAMISVGSPDASAFASFPVSQPAEIAARLTAPSVVEPVRADLLSRDLPDVKVGGAHATLRRSWNAAVIALGSSVAEACMLNLAAEADFAVSASADESTIHIQVQATHPHLPGLLAPLLLENLRSDLTSESHRLARGRLDETQSALALAQSRLNEVDAELLAFRQEAGRFDARQWAAALEAEIRSAQSESVAAARTYDQVEQQYHTVLRQLEEIEREQLAEVITRENPRIAELRSEISNLNAEYNSLTQLTDKHPDKIALRTQIEAKEAELALESQRSTQESRTAPSPAYQTLLNDKLRLNRELNGLAASEAGLTLRLEGLHAEMSEATALAQRMDEIDRRHAAALADVERLQAREDDLQQVLSNQRLFDHLSLLRVDQPADAAVPDQPATLLYAGATLALALLLSTLVPAVLACARGSLVSESHLHRIAEIEGFQIVGDLHPPRRLLPAR